MFSRKKKDSQSPRRDDSSSAAGSPTTGNVLTSKMRGMVSMNKVRFQEDGFDLDLTYITTRLIAMGFPSHGAESLYRNPVEKVEEFFNARHKDHYRIYNLCSERQYDKESRFNGAYKCFPFDDHNAPAPIRIIPDFVDDVKAFLEADERNVAAVHCKAGKSRTGVLIASYLMATDPSYRKPKAALERFASLRTNDGHGVNIPSQQRYVGYWDQVLDQYGGRPPPTPPIKIEGLTVKGGSKGWDLYFEIREGPMRTGKDAITRFDSRKTFGFKSAVSGPGSFSFDLSPFELLVRGDIKIVFKASKRVGSDEHLFHLWLNTAFVEDGPHSFPKTMLDKASKDTKHKEYKSDLSVMLTTGPAPEDARQRGDSEFFSPKSRGGSENPASPQSANTMTSSSSSVSESPFAHAEPVSPCPFPGSDDKESAVDSAASPAAVPPPEQPTQPPQPVDDVWIVPPEAVPAAPAVAAAGSDQGGSAAAPGMAAGDGHIDPLEEIVIAAATAVEEEPSETPAERHLRELREQRQARQLEREAEKERREKERKEAEEKRKAQAAAREARQRDEAEARQRERDERRRQRDQERAAAKPDPTPDAASVASPFPPDLAQPHSPSASPPPPAGAATAATSAATPDPSEDPLAALYSTNPVPPPDTEAAVGQSDPSVASTHPPERQTGAAEGFLPAAEGLESQPQAAGGEAAGLTPAGVESGVGVAGIAEVMGGGVDAEGVVEVEAGPSLDIPDEEAEREVRQREVLREHRKRLFDVEGFNARIEEERREERQTGALDVYGTHREVASLARSIIKRVEAIEAACSYTLKDSARKAEGLGAPQHSMPVAVREPLTLVALSLLQRSSRLEIMCAYESEMRKLKAMYRMALSRPRP